MTNEPVAENYAAPRPRRRLQRMLFRCAAVTLLAWLFAAYFLLPLLWRRFERRHPALDGTYWITHTGNNIPGDPLNVALVGNEEDLQRAMLAAKWYPADPITLKSSLRIAAGTVFHRSYVRRPGEQSLFLPTKTGPGLRATDRQATRNGGITSVSGAAKNWTKRAGRSGSAPRRSTVPWGSVIPRSRSRTTSLADIDPERDKIIDDIRAVGHLTGRLLGRTISRRRRHGKNGGGDPWHTDGRLEVGVLRDE